MVEVVELDWNTTLELFKKMLGALDYEGHLPEIYLFSYTRSVINKSIDADSSKALELIELQYTSWHKIITFFWIEHKWLLYV